MSPPLPVAHLGPAERRVVEHFIHRKPAVRDTNAEFSDRRTLGEQLADRVAAFGGSWRFIGLFAAVLVAWVVLNSVVLARRHDAFDPYPYILLNLFLSMLAAIQAPVIMMSQNRQAAKDRLDAANDYEVNLRAELEIRTLHEKLDALRDAQWAELVRMQQQQIALLMRLADRGPTLDGEIDAAGAPAP